MAEHVPPVKAAAEGATGHAPVAAVVAAALGSRCARRRVGRAEPEEAVAAGEPPRPAVEGVGVAQTRRLAPRQAVAAAVVVRPKNVPEREVVAAQWPQSVTAGAQRRSAPASMCLRNRADARTASLRH